MSFSVSVPKTEKEDFEETVDNIDYPSNVTEDDAKSLFDAAKSALVDLSEAFSGDKPLTGSISGHAHSGNDYDKNSVNVAISETDK